MARTPEQSLERFIRTSEGQSIAPSAYLNYLRGVPTRRDWKPFFVELVDNNGDLKEIPWPQNDSGGRILGIKFMINPQSISVNMAKIVGRTQTMTGWLEEHWGEELDTVTFSGSTAAFVTGSSRLKDARQMAEKVNRNRGQVRSDFYSYLGLDNLSVPYQTSVAGSRARNALDVEPGLTTIFRRQSLSYREMRKLNQIMTSNGCVFSDDGFVSDRRFIRLSYDYSSYIGYFESLDITEDANAPFKFVYTATFKAEKTAYSYVTRRNVNGQAAGQR